MVGKNRNTTNSPRITGVGVWIFDRAAESCPGGVVMRFHATRNIGMRFIFDFFYWLRRYRCRRF
jgi:hypothetical protein